jgi:proteasome beta subunit
MTQTDESMDTGTTTLGIVGDNFVLLASDKRASMGKYIASHDVKKVKPLTEHVAITFAGTVSTIQFVKKVAQSRLRLKELNSGRKSTVQEAASVLTNINFRNSRQPLPTAASFIVGGVDDEPRLFDVQPDGAMYELPKDTQYRAGGSGRMMAQSILDDNWQPDMSEEDAIELAVRALTSAVKRDSGSGSGMYVTIVDEDGFRVVKETDTLPTVKE